MSRVLNAINLEIEYFEDVGDKDSAHVYHILKNRELRGMTNDMQRIAKVREVYEDEVYNDEDKDSLVAARLEDFLNINEPSRSIDLGELQKVVYTFPEGTTVVQASEELFKLGIRCRSEDLEKVFA
jgi:hypothetical protein